MCFERGIIPYYRRWSKNQTSLCHPFFRLSFWSDSNLELKPLVSDSLWVFLIPSVTQHVQLKNALYKKDMLFKVCVRGLQRNRFVRKYGSMDLVRLMFADEVLVPVTSFYSVYCSLLLQLGLSTCVVATTKSHSSS